MAQLVLAGRKAPEALAALAPRVYLAPRDPLAPWPPLALTGHYPQKHPVAHWVQQGPMDPPVQRVHYHQETLEAPQGQMLPRSPRDQWALLGLEPLTPR